MSQRTFKSAYAIAIISTLFVSVELHAQEQHSASQAFTEGTKQFLSDPARTGSLVGSILAGAAIANPLAPLLGSVAGFMIGKSSAFSDNDRKATDRQAYANRSLIPRDGTQITNLAGLTGTASQEVVVGLSDKVGKQSQQDSAEPTIAAAVPRETEAISQSIHREQILFVQLPEESGRQSRSEKIEQSVALDLTGGADVDAVRSIQKQLAYACSNMQLSKPMSLSCYYHSQ